MPPPDSSIMSFKFGRSGGETSSPYPALLSSALRRESLKPPQLYELYAKDLPSLYGDSPAGLRGRSVERSYLVTLDKGNLEKKHQYDSAIQDWNDGKTANRPAPPVWHTYNPKDRAINFWKCVALEQYEEQQKNALEDAGTIITKDATNGTSGSSSGTGRTDPVATNVATASPPASATNATAQRPLSFAGNRDYTPSFQFGVAPDKPTSKPIGIIGDTAASTSPDDVVADAPSSSASSETLIGDGISVNLEFIKNRDDPKGREDPADGYNSDVTEDAPYAANYADASQPAKKPSTAPTTKDDNGSVDGVVTNSGSIVSNPANTLPARDKPNTTALKKERSPVATKTMPVEGGGNTLVSDSKDDKSTTGSITLRLRQIVESAFVDNKNGNRDKDDKCSGCDSSNCSCNEERHSDCCEDPECLCNYECSSSEDEEGCSGCHDHDCPCNEDCTSEYPCDDPYCPNLEVSCDGGCDDPDCDCNNCEGCDDPDCYCNDCEECGEPMCICDDDRSSAMYDSDAGCDGCSDMDCDCTNTDESDDEQESDASDDDDPMEGISNKDSKDTTAPPTKLPKKLPKEGIKNKERSPSTNPSGTKTGTESSRRSKKETSSAPVTIPKAPQDIKTAKTGTKRPRSDKDEGADSHHDQDAPGSESSSPTITSKRRRLTSEDSTASGSVNKASDAYPELLKKLTGIDEKLDRLTTAMDTISKKVDKSSDCLKSAHAHVECLEETINTVTDEHASHTLHHVNMFHEVLMEEVKKVQKKLKRNLKY